MGMLLLLNLLTTGKTQSGFFFFFFYPELRSRWRKHSQNLHWATFSSLSVFANCNTCSWKKIKSWNTSLKSCLPQRAAYKDTHTLPVSLKHRMLQCSQQNISLCVCSPMMRTVIWETFLALASPSLLQCGPFFVCLRMTEGDSWIKIEV